MNDDDDREELIYQDIYDAWRNNGPTRAAKLIKSLPKRLQDKITSRLMQAIYDKVGAFHYRTFENKMRELNGLKPVYVTWIIG